MLFLTLARIDYAFYCRYVHAGQWEYARHIDLVCKTLEAVERGDITRLMIFEPPRHGKSMTVTETFPSFFIGKNPERRVIETSYGADLAEQFGNRNRQKIENYGMELFGIQLDKASASKTQWAIDGHRGGMISAGIGGAITGQGADLLLIDDLIKNRAEAESETYRERIWQEWRDTLLTRLHPNGRVIIVMTRWHPDDLAGRLLREEGRIENGGKWTVLEFAAEAMEPYEGKDDSETIYPDALGREPGQALWPEHGFNEEWLADQKAAVGSYTFSALYQQRPRNRDQNRMFRREWFKIVDDWPRNARPVRSWDMAATEADGKNDADFTAGVKMCEQNGQYWIIDVKHGRWTPQGVEAIIKQTALTDGVQTGIQLEQEGGSAGKTVVDHYRRNVLQGFTVYADKPTGDKSVRATPLSAAAEAGNVFVVRGAWNEVFLEEMDNFLIRGHDDQVDAASAAYNALNRKFVFLAGKI